MFEFLFWMDSYKVLFCEDIILWFVTFYNKTLKVLSQWNFIKIMYKYYRHDFIYSEIFTFPAFIKLVLNLR